MCKTGDYLCIRRQAISQQQQSQASVSAGKELTPAHQASIPQAPRTNPVYQSTGYTNVSAQVCKKKKRCRRLSDLLMYCSLALRRSHLKARQWRISVKDSRVPGSAYFASKICEESHFSSVHRAQDTRIRRIRRKSYHRLCKCSPPLRNTRCIRMSDWRNFHFSIYWENCWSPLV